MSVGMKLKSRQYIHSVAIYKRDETTTNDYNEPTDVDTLYCRRAARLLTQGARELVNARQVQGELTHRFFVLSDEQTRNITPKMSLKWDSRTFDVIGTWDKDGLRREVVIDCKEAV